VPGRGLVAAALALAVAVGSAACVSTTDEIGHNGPAGIKLKPLARLPSYPNPFRDELGKADADIQLKIDDAFAQLYHGDPLTQAIFVVDSADQAHIQDFFHGDTRTEGLGWGMVIAVELDKRDDFDDLWRFSKAERQFTTGAAAGYFRSSCDTESGPAPCTDPFGMEQFVTALLFAHDRWGATPGPIDYGKDALALLDVMRHKQEANGGIVDDVTDAFDSVTRLPFDFPNKGSAGRTRPSVVMPAYYELWEQATSDQFWSRAAARGRQLLKDSAHPTTGLLPVRATFDGAAVSAGGSDSFQPESYRSQLNIALDYIWSGEQQWNIEESTRLLKFFTMKGFDTYGTSFELKGDTINPAHEVALQITNGMTALPAINAPDRQDYMQVVWDMNTPSGPVRYYQGLCYLLALLLLSGQFRVY